MHWIGRDSAPRVSLTDRTGKDRWRDCPRPHKTWYGSSRSRKASRRSSILRKITHLITSCQATVVTIRSRRVSSLRTAASKRSLPMSTRAGPTPQELTTNRSVSHLPLPHNTFGAKCPHRGLKSKNRRWTTWKCSRKTSAKSEESRVTMGIGVVLKTLASIICSTEPTRRKKENYSHQY